MMFMLPTISLRIERWKFNKDYGIYVSTLGNFKDRYKRRLPIKITQGGYCMVKTEASSQPWKLAHRVVMLTWKPIPDAENLTVDHLNHNKRDNSIANLEWVTQEENSRRAKEDYIIIEQQIKKEEKARRKAERLAKIAGYSIDGEGCYTKQEAIEKLVAIRGENSRKLTIKAFKNLENGTNQEGSKTFGRQTVKHIVKVIYKNDTN